MKIAIIDKAPSSANYNKYFSFNFDLYHLCSRKLTKVLKKDVDIEINKEDYDFIITVGSEASKFFAGITSVTDYNGFLVQDKYIPLLNPAMLTFKPEAKPSFERAVEQIHKIINGENLINKDGEFLGINNEDEALAYLNKVDEWAKEYGIIAVDTETTSLYPRDGYILGISICGAPRKGAYISSDCINELVYDKFQELFKKYKVVFHNSKFDIKMLEYHFNFEFNEVYDDTLILHYTLDETQGSHGLKQLAIKYTEYGDYDRELEEFKTTYCKQHRILQEDFTYDLIPFDIISKYAAIDTCVTFELFQKFNPILRKNDKLSNLYDKLLIPGSTFLKNIEEVGIPFSRDRLKFGEITIGKSIEIAQNNLRNYPEVIEFEQEQGASFNPNSVVQLRKLLFDKLHLDPIDKRTAGGAQSTDSEVLDSIQGQHPLVDDILNIRKLGKIKNTYIDKIILGLDKDDRLRTGFNLTSTTSGRLSSSGKFNAQQIPRDEARVKGAIWVPDGYKIFSQDLATAEMYYAAVLSGDLDLQKVFISGGDFHSSIAKQVFRLPCNVEDVKRLYPAERQAAKAISFGILYGSGPQKVSDTVSKESNTVFSLQDAKEAIDDYFGTYKKLAKWLKDTKAFIETNGFIYTSFGRKRRLKNVFSQDKGIASHEVRSGINATIQALASDINLIAGIETNKELKRKDIPANIFMLVHDSIVSIVRDDAIEDFGKLLKSITQKDRGFSIKGCPIGIDQDFDQDYSFGKFNEVWGKEYERFIQNPISYIPS